MEETGLPRVLVVDDNEVNREVLSLGLSLQVCQVETAEDGIQALQMLNKDAYDLVLLDMVMPGMSGYDVLRYMKSHQEWMHIPVIMISAVTEREAVVRCIQRGAEDCLQKPFDPVLLRARVGACLEKKRMRDREQRYMQEIVESQEQIANQLIEAAEYVRSLLPRPITDGEVKADWRLHTSRDLGGDSLGYHWLNKRYFAAYLLDVCGHGVGSALLSVSVLNILRTQSLPETDFCDPAQVLAALNETFPMERHNNRFFTMWYGIYDRVLARLMYASAGHPPPVLVHDDTAHLLEGSDLIIGCRRQVTYENRSLNIPPSARLYVYSDGGYERQAGNSASLDEFIGILSAPSIPGVTDLDRIVRNAHELREGESFEDDFSILEIVFPEPRKHQGTKTPKVTK